MQWDTECAENTLVLVFNLAHPHSKNYVYLKLDLKKMDSVWKRISSFKFTSIFLDFSLKTNEVLNDLNCLKSYSLSYHYLQCTFQPFKNNSSYLNLHQDEVYSHAPNHEKILCQLNSCKPFSRNGMGCKPIVRLQSLKVLVKI